MQTRELKVARWEDVSLTTSEDQYNRSFQEHFREVFAAHVMNDPKDIGVSQPAGHRQWQRCSPAEERVHSAIVDLRDNKAIGPDRIPAELLKAGGEQCTRRFHELLQKIWQCTY